MFSTNLMHRRFWIPFALLAATLLCGCSKPASPAAHVSSSPQQEYWEVVLIRGARVGYVRTTITPERRDGRDLVRIEGINHLVFQRGGEKGVLDSEFTSLETPDGQLIEFATVTQMGTEKSKTTGRVVGDKLEIQADTLGKTVTNRIAWSPEYGGFYALEQSLRRKPMRPGEKRSLRLLLLGFNELVTAELAARDYERTPLLTGSYDLLRIDSQLVFADGRKLPSTGWTDRTGEILKNSSEMMSMESYQVTKAEALDEKDLGKIDLLAGMAVQLKQPLIGAHQAKRITYQVALEHGDPAAVFVSGPSQEVKSIDPHTAAITVYALRPGQGGGNSHAADDPPTAGDRQPNNTIQSDDPAVVALAKEGAGDAKDPWTVAVALERYVNHIIQKKDFSQAFATAAEVARSREGDCTEHAVLLAALARARGIPARVAMGLVYVDRAQAFLYHMWTEVFIEGDGRWIAIDATLAQGGIGAGHLKLAHSNLKGVSPYSSFLPVVQVMGQLQVEVKRMVAGGG
jgi:hypothetical protein